MEKEIVKAKITRVEHYALYVTDGERQIIVLVPDVSNERIHLKEKYKVDQLVSVQIIKYIPQENIFKATMIF
jgi:ribosomal protein S1